MVVVKRFNGTQSAKLSYDNAAFLFKIGGLTINVFLIIGIVLLIAAYVVLYKTRFGLRLQACGEHPQAADSVGINVYKMRWSGVLISGFLAGIGGFAYIVPAVQTWNFEVGVAGMTTQKTELEKLQKDNETLQTSIDSLNEQNDKLSGSVDALTDENKQLSALNVVYSEKAKFLDTYVVFVENDGTRLYHKYDCSHFARKSFWAYSRKLAEKYGFTACPYCFG